MKKYVQRKLSGTVTIRTLLRTCAVVALVASAGSVYLGVVVVPDAAAAVKDWYTWEQEIVIDRPTQADNSTTTDPLTQYYNKFYAENEQKFEDLRHSDAMEKAIDKRTADLEKERESLRENELFR